MSDPEDIAHFKPPPVAIPWAVIWSMLAFLVGTIFSAGMGWGHNNGSIDNMALQVAQMRTTLDVLTTAFNSANIDSHERLKALETEVTIMRGDVTNLQRTPNK
jgi:hypothetical protein